MSPTRIAVTMIVLGSTVVLPSCGASSASPGSPSPDGGSVDEASGSQGMESGLSFSLAAVASPECVTLATAMCERLATCSPETFAAYDGAPRCIRDLAYECPLGRPGNLATLADVTTCADAYTALECHDVIEGNSPPACDRVTHGTHDQPAPCAVDGECSSGHCGNRMNGCGQCENIPAPGTLCGSVGTFCGPHAGCDADVLCRPVAGVGAPCCDRYTEAGLCDPPGRSVCEKGLQCAGGTCAPRLDLGVACTTPYDCRPGLYCHGVTATCTAPRVVEQGRCGQDTVSMDWSICRPGSLCRAIDGPEYASGGGVCSPLREEGQPCGEDGIVWNIGEGQTPPTPCRAPALCINGTCVVAYVCP